MSSAEPTFTEVRPTILYPDGVPIMHHLIPKGVSGDAEIRHRVLNEKRARSDNLRYSVLGYPKWMEIEPGTYCTLFIGDGIMMSDTPMERRTNMPFLSRAYGHVLIGGLGIGMLPAALTRGAIPARSGLGTPPVESITILEKNPGVVDLVEPYLLHPRITIIEADVFDYEPDRLYDMIYMDIWPDISNDNAKEVRDLNRKYRQHLTGSGPYSTATSWVGQYIQGMEGSGPGLSNIRR